MPTTVHGSVRRLPSHPGDGAGRAPGPGRPAASTPRLTPSPPTTRYSVAGVAADRVQQLLAGQVLGQDQPGSAAGDTSARVVHGRRCGRQVDDLGTPRTIARLRPCAVDHHDAARRRSGWPGAPPPTPACAAGRYSDGRISSASRSRAARSPSSAIRSVWLAPNHRNAGHREAQRGGRSRWPGPPVRCRRAPRCRAARPGASSAATPGRTRPRSGSPVSRERPIVQISACTSRPPSSGSPGSTLKTAMTRLLQASSNSSTLGGGLVRRQQADRPAAAGQHEARPAGRPRRSRTRRAAGWPRPRSRTPRRAGTPRSGGPAARAPG